MVVASRLSGFFISVVCHGLLLLIPITVATKAPELYPPVEFVMTLAEKPLTSDPPPQAVEPPKPEPVRPKPKIKPRPRPKPVITEPVETKTLMPQPRAAAAPPPAPVRARAGVGAGASTGPHLAEFGSSTGPAFLRRVLPVYPDQARRLGKQGRVVLRLTIDAGGNLVNLEVVQAAGFGFEESAVAAVKRSSFRPAKVQGQPVTSVARLPIRFAIKD
jgi:periplasmic protein TonB